MPSRMLDRDRLASKVAPPFSSFFFFLLSPPLCGPKGGCSENAVWFFFFLTYDLSIWAVRPGPLQTLRCVGKLLSFLFPFPFLPSSSSSHPSVIRFLTPGQNQASLVLGDRWHSLRKYKKAPVPLFFLFLFSFIPSFLNPNV